MNIDYTPVCLSQLASALLISFKIMHHRTSLAQHALHTLPVAPANGTPVPAGAKGGEKKENYWTF